MEQTTRRLGNYYAPHGDSNVQDARQQVTIHKHAMSVTIVRLGGTTQRNVTFADGTEFKWVSFTRRSTRMWSDYQGARGRG